MQSLVSSLRNSPAGKQPETLVEPLEDVASSHDSHTRGGELERERQAIQSTAKLSDVGRILCRHLEVNAGCKRSVAEQTDRLVGAERVAIRGIEVRQR